MTGSSEVNLTAGSGISVSGTSPDFSISNTNRGSSQKIFKNVEVTGQSTLVSDSNNDTLTFAEGSGIDITTTAGTDTITISSTGSSVAFSAVTAGTNTNALLIGTGGSLGVTGAGTITLKKGQTKIFVPTALITEKSQVLVTPDTIISGGVAVTKKEPGKGFTVEIAAPENKDVTVDWLLVN